MSLALVQHEQKQTAPSRPGRTFASAGVTASSWYCVARAKSLQTHSVQAVELGETRVALWRGVDGRALAIDARCQHLGADLAQGSIVNGRLVCPMHAWEMGPGACERGLLPTVEAHGLIFVHAGMRPVSLPGWVRSPSADDDQPPAHPWLLPPQIIRASGHLVLGNGFDTQHYRPLHGVDLLDVERRADLENATYTVDIHARLVGKRRWRLLGLLGSTIKARFIGVGAGLTWVVCGQPVPFRVLFSATPLPAASGGGCRTQVAFFPPAGSPVSKVRALALMYALVCDDRRVLEAMRFRPNWTPADACLQGYADLIDGLPVFHEGGIECG